MISGAAFIAATRVLPKLREGLDGRPAEVEIYICEDDESLLVHAYAGGRVVTAAATLAALDGTPIDVFARYLEARLRRPLLRIGA